MKIERLGQGILFTPDVHQDDRGFFIETFNPHYHFHPVQASMSKSRKGVVRGLHYMEYGVSKLVWVVSGAIYDVAFNLDTGEYTGVELTADNHKQFLIPEYCAHGFQALEDDTIVCYLQDSAFEPTKDKGINPSIVKWPITPIFMSDKDRNADKYTL